jgi:hypothetical protein
MLAVHTAVLAQLDPLCIGAEPDRAPLAEIECLLWVGAIQAPIALFS